MNDRLLRPNCSSVSIAAWDKKEYKCSRGPGCQLWEDDDMLLEEDQRPGGAVAQERVVREVAHQAPIPDMPVFRPPPPPPYQHIYGDFGWIEDDGKLGTGAVKQLAKTFFSYCCSQAQFHRHHDRRHYLWLL